MTKEYEDPGYFPGQFNRGVLHSEQPDHYPLNSNIALIINVPLAYTFYARPSCFPRSDGLGSRRSSSGLDRPSAMA